MTYEWAPYAKKKVMNNLTSWVSYEMLYSSLKLTLFESFWNLALALTHATSLFKTKRS